jgi:DNA transformation protein
MNAPSSSMITDTRDPLARRNSNSRRHFNFDNWTTGVKREIKDLPNLGQFMSKRLAEIGITNEDELRKIGAGQAYVRLKFLFGREITLNALWAMDATLSGIDWRLLSEERKQELLAQLPKLGR